MKILFYNWVDYLDSEKRGGGVSVYQRNVLDYLSKNTDHELYFLSGGISYDLINSDVRISKMDHGKKPSSVDMEKVERFEIVNSPVLSPAHHSFGNEAQVSDEDTERAFLDFVEKHGPFDAIHFNNLEGIPAKVLQIKKQHPDTKVILSMHNYYPFCPQVNLWYQEKEHCDDYFYGKKCIGCLSYVPNEYDIKRANSIAFSLKKTGIEPGSKIFSNLFKVELKALRFYEKRGFGEKLSLNYQKTDSNKNKLFKEISGEKYIKRRTEFVRLINENCDHVLAVSDRVGEITVSYGIKKELVVTDYIGTKYSEIYSQTPTPQGLITDKNGELTLTYLGYMRRDKGFYFFVDALYNMPPDLANKINIVVAARNTAPEQLEILKGQIWKFNSISYADGYTHKTLPDILSKTNVGIIPVQWEDNLPQVAIEMHSQKIPLITSHRGGAHELSNNPDFTFNSDSQDELYTILQKIVDGNLKHEDYWANAMKPIGLEEHCSKLTKVFFRQTN